jgi:hypothetical protein
MTLSHCKWQGISGAISFLEFSKGEFAFTKSGVTGGVTGVGGDDLSHTSGTKARSK